MKKRRSFFLIEVLIGIGLILAVSLSVLSVEHKMAQEVQRAGIELQMTTAYNRALTLLVEKLSKKEIPFGTIDKGQEIEYDLDYLNWRAKCAFKVKKSAPETNTKAFLIKSKITLLHPETHETAKEGKFAFALSLDPQSKPGS